MPIIPITWQNLTNAAINGDGYLEKTVDTLAGAGCMDNASGTGDAGARSVEEITGPDWEFVCTLGPDTGSGRSFVGIQNSTFSLNFAVWQYCLHVSTFDNTSGDPHPPDSLFVYRGSPPNVEYRNGIWDEGKELRLVCVGSTVRAYLDSLLVYTFSGSPTYPIYAVASLACLGGTVVNPRFITSASGGGGGGTTCEPGEETGSACSMSQAMPTPGGFPTAQKPDYFAEVEGDWGTHSQTFRDGMTDHNTIQGLPIRRFEFEYVGLSVAQAAEVDAHWDSTWGGLPFTLTVPRTGEVITGVRYDGKLERTPHDRVVWQTRSGRLIKYTA